MIVVPPQFIMREHDLKGTVTCPKKRIGLRNYRSPDLLRSVSSPRRCPLAPSEGSLKTVMLRFCSVNAFVILYHIFIGLSRIFCECTLESIKTNNFLLTKNGIICYNYTNLPYQKNKYLLKSYNGVENIEGKRNIGH